MNWNGYNDKSRHRKCHGKSQRGTALHNIFQQLNLRFYAPSVPKHISTVSFIHNSIIDLSISQNLLYTISSTVINHTTFDKLTVCFKNDIFNPLSPPTSVDIDWKKIQSLYQ